MIQAGILEKSCRPTIAYYFSLSVVLKIFFYFSTTHYDPSCGVKVPPFIWVRIVDLALLVSRLYQRCEPPLANRKKAQLLKKETKQKNLFTHVDILKR